MPPETPDLIIRDMFFVPVEVKSDAEFPMTHYDLHVVVRNVGTVAAKNFLVEVISDEKVTEFDHVLVDPATDAHLAGPSINVLAPGEEKVIAWKQAAEDTPGFGAHFYIAIVDRPIGSDQFGHVLEGPTIAAEKNNTMGIPAPGK